MIVGANEHSPLRRNYFHHQFTWFYQQSIVNLNRLLNFASLSNNLLKNNPIMKKNIYYIHFTCICIISSSKSRAHWFHDSSTIGFEFLPAKNHHFHWAAWSATNSEARTSAGQHHWHTPHCKQGLLLCGELRERLCHHCRRRPCGAHFGLFHHKHFQPAERTRQCGGMVGRI